MREELVTVHFDGITHIDMTYGLAVQQMQKHIDKTDAEIARLNALLAEAREELERLSDVVCDQDVASISAVVAKLGA